MTLGGTPAAHVLGGASIASAAITRMSVLAAGDGDQARPRSSDRMPWDSADVDRSRRPARAAAGAYTPWMSSQVSGVDSTALTWSRMKSMSTLLAAGGPCAAPVGVRRADDPVGPSDHEQHRLLRAQDHAGLGADPVSRNHDVHALDARTWNPACPPARVWMSSVHTPVALMMTEALTSTTLSVSTSRTLAPTMRSRVMRTDDLGGVQHAP